MKITSAAFIKSSPNYKECPAGNIPEFAFIGRSNVGKSSLINMLVGRKDLAKTSGKPGKTQLINHYLINETWYLVDLPGYGFAKVDKVTLQKWDKMIKDYLLQRENLHYTFVLVDSRIEPQKNDLNFINWLGSHNVPLCIVFTKADKQSISKTQSGVAAFKKALQENWEELPIMFTTSAEKMVGKEDLLNFILKK